MGDWKGNNYLKGNNKQEEISLTLHLGILMYKKST